MGGHIPPPWMTSKRSKRKLYILHIESLYNASLKGCHSFGAASPVRRYSKDEIAAINHNTKNGRK
jgi:hypothetical protein